MNYVFYRIFHKAKSKVNENKDAEEFPGYVISDDRVDMSVELFRKALQKIEWVFIITKVSHGEEDPLLLISKPGIPKIIT